MFRSPHRLLLFPLLLALSACFIVKPHGSDELVMSREEFGKYVERVFRYHNQVMNELIESEADRGELDHDEDAELSAAEARMIELCRPLNEAVAAELTGESVGLVTELGLVESVPACENASHEVEDLMP